MDDWPYMIGTIVVALAILLVGGWWLNRKTGERIGEAMREQRDVRAKEILLGWGEGSDPETEANAEGINPWDDGTPDSDGDEGENW